MTRKLFPALLLCLVVMGSCKRQKLQRSSLPSISSETDVTSFKAADTLPDSLYIRTEFAYIATKSKITIRSRQQNIDNASVSFRIKKDSAIWISASVLGVEVIRGILSVESVRLLDRMNKAYIEASYRTLASRLSFPLDYPLLQGLLLADLPHYTGQRFELKDTDDKLLVRQTDGYLAVYNMIDHILRKTTRMEAVDLISGNKAIAEYSNMQSVDEGLIPYSIQMSLSGKETNQSNTSGTLNLSITHSSVTTTDSTLAFPFQVPNNYKKAF